MRAIEFRGFSVFDDNWVYGLLIRHENDTSIIEDQEGIPHICHTSSIGQFIGLRALGDVGKGWDWVGFRKDGTRKVMTEKYDEKALDFNFMNENGFSSMEPVNNGPKLYEGDIVSSMFTNNKRKKDGRLYTERVNSLIVFCEKSLRCKLKRLERGRDYRGTYTFDIGWDIRLVGNSTENPEMIKEIA